MSILLIKNKILLWKYNQKLKFILKVSAQKFLEKIYFRMNNF
jgi:hypothetical protein